LLPSGEYAPYSDEYPGYACNSLDYRGRKAATAQAKIVGNDPLPLSVVNLGDTVDLSYAAG
jgi:hypothetical protein